MEMRNSIIVYNIQYISLTLCCTNPLSILQYFIFMWYWLTSYDKTHININAGVCNILKLQITYYMHRCLQSAVRIPLLSLSSV